MKFFTRSTTRRNAASFMLSLWLFVLGSGFANACLLEAPDHGGHQPSSESSHSGGHAAAPAHDGEPNSRAPCLKACDEGAQALQSSNGVESVDPGAPPLAAVLWTTPTLLPVHHWSGFDDPPLLSDPPARITYSRWAL